MMYISTRISITLFLAMMLLSSLEAQRNYELMMYEDSLKSIAPQILYGSHDFNKYEANEQFSELLWEVLHLDNSFNYAFDSLQTISILSTPNNMFRIFTWNLQKSDGSYDYFGMIQMNPRKAEADLVYKLHNSKKTSTVQAMQEVFDTENWYGAHYYNMIQSRYRGKNFYTLLGWDGNNIMTTRKIIEIITINKNGAPEFGAPVIQTNNALKHRYIIEYGAHVAVSLKYERHYLYEGKNRKRMIVFDRVAPLSPMLEGQYRFYVPETNIYDAFIFEKGKWMLYEDVDARNPKIPKRVLRERQKEQEKRFFLDTK